MRPVSIWLRLCTVLAFAMIVAGGITRVTRSGLSITTWEPVTGVLPPTSDAAWQRAFDRWRASPEGRARRDVTEDPFRPLYLVEWAHRVLARTTALAFGLPLAVFALRRELDRRRVRWLALVLGAVVAQGALGWLMVASGLVDAPHVSPFRLAAHFVVGASILAAFGWAAAERASSPPPRGARAATLLALGLAAITVALGALMAGFHAGLVCATFPRMNGAWAPPLRASAWDAMTIHFLHRLFAVLVTLASLAAAARLWGASRAAPLLAVSVVLQPVLGALVVLRHVPPALAVVHQANGALVVLLLAVLARRVVFARGLGHDVSHGAAGATAAA